MDPLLVRHLQAFIDPVRGHPIVTPGGGPPGRSQNLQGRDREVHGVLALGHDHQAEHRHSRAGIKGLVQ